MYNLYAKCLDHRQNARSGIEKKIWEKIRGWSRDDSAVLSGNQSAQIERVLTQPYAYINDVTGFELEMSRTCDLGLLDDLFLPAEYAVGLLENSYFTADISAEYVAVTSFAAACHAL